MSDVAQSAASRQFRNNQKWALGHLRGQVQGYRRGNVRIANVAAAVRIAERWNVPLLEIHALLRAAGLVYDAAAKLVRAA